MQEGPLGFVPVVEIKDFNVATRLETSPGLLVDVPPIRESSRHVAEMDQVVSVGFPLPFPLLSHQHKWRSGRDFAPYLAVVHLKKDVDWHGSRLHWREVNTRHWSGRQRLNERYKEEEARLANLHIPAKNRPFR